MYVYLTLMTSLYSAKRLRIMLIISGEFLDDCVNMGLNLNRRSEGQIVSAAGYRLDHSNVEAVRTLKDSKPSTVCEVRRLLGLLRYYRRYIQNFARIAHPLFQILQAASEDVAKSAHKTKQRFNGGSVPSSRPVVWMEQHKKPAETLLDRLVSPPILGYPDFSKPFVLYTDASQKGLGAVLYQKQDGKM